MTNTIKRLALSIIVLLVCGPGLAEDGKSYEVRGQLVNASTGAGIDGVEAYLAAKTPTPGVENSFTCRTDANGNFLFTHKRAGQYTLRIHVQGFYAPELEKSQSRTLSLTLGEGLPNDPLRLEMHPLGAVKGRVTFADGSPLVNGEVQVVATKEDRMRSSRHGEAKTDMDGSFTVRHQNPGESMKLMVHSHLAETPYDGNQQMWYLGESELFDIPSGATGTVEVRLPELAQVSGIVTDASGNPVTRGRIAFDSIKQNYTAPQVYRGMPYVSIAPDGHWSITGMPAGTYRIRCQIEGFLNAYSDEFVLKAGTNPPVEMKLIPSFDIAGTVTYNNGKPAVNITVRTEKKDYESVQGPSFATTDKNGRFKLTNLKQDIYNLEVEYLSGGQKILVRDIKGGTKDVAITLDNPAIVHGLVLDASTGQPVNSFRVTPYVPSTRYPNNWTNSQQTFHGSQGRFSVEIPPATQCFVIVSSENHVAAESDIIPVTAGVELPPMTIRLERGHVLSGRIVSASTGQPLPDIYVSASGKAASRHNRGLHFQGGHGKTDEHGIFELKHIPPGAFSLDIHQGSRGFPYLQRKIETIEVNGDTNIGDIPLTGASKLVGMMYDAQQKPATGCHVVLQAVQGPGAGLPEYAHLPVRDGQFESGMLHAGRYEVKVQFSASEGYSGVSLASPEIIDIPTAQVASATFRIPAGYELKGRVLRDGKPFAEARLLFQHEDETDWQRRNASAISDVNGEYKVALHKPGQWWVHGMVGQSTQMETFAYLRQLKIEENGSGNWDFSLEGREFSGQVLSPTGVPLQRSQIRLQPVLDENTALNRRNAFAISARNEGRFTMRIGKSGTYLVQASDGRETAQSSDMRITVGESDLVNYTFQTLKTVALEVQFNTEECNACPDMATIKAIDGNGNRKDFSTIPLAQFQSGRSMPLHLIPGAYTLEVTDGSGKVYASEKVVVNEGTPNKVTLNLK